VTNGSQFPAVAVATNPHGDVLLAWTTSGGPGAALSVRRAGGTFSAPAAITSGDGFNAGSPRVALDDAGRGTVAVAESMNASDMGCSTVPLRIFDRARIYAVSPDGGVTAGPVLGSDDGCLTEGGGQVDPPVLDVNGRGDAVAAVRAKNAVHWASRSLATGTFGAFGTSPAGGSSPTAAIADSGRVVVGDTEGGLALLRIGIAGSAPGTPITMSGALSGVPYAVAGIAADNTAALGFTDNDDRGVNRDGHRDRRRRQPAIADGRGDRDAAPGPGRLGGATDPYAVRGGRRGDGHLRA
jgi:hypothetical protein